MAFNDPNVTVIRRGLDNTATLASVTNAEQRIPFPRINQYGYLRKLYLSLAQNVGVTAVGTGGLTQQNGGQFPQARLISRFALRLQNIGPLYDCTGLDLMFLNWVRHHSVKKRGDLAAGFSVIGALPTTNPYPFAFPTFDNSLLGMMSTYAPYLAYLAGSTSLTVGYAMEIPLTEKIVWPNVVLAQQGQTQILSDMEMEVGMIDMQIGSANLVPDVYREPNYGPLTINAALLSTGSATATTTAEAWTFESEYWDVAVLPTDRPSAWAQGWSIQVTAQDVPVSAGGCTVLYAQGGLLTRMLFEAFNDGTNYGTLVDLTAAANTPWNCYFELHSGPNVIRTRENVMMNAHRSMRRYESGVPGIVVFDLIGEGTITQALETVDQTNIKLVVTGLPASVTRLHCVEQRFLNIQPAV